MTKEEVISIRNTLRGGDNRFALRVFIADNITVVDESAIATSTKWDDENGFIYLFRLPSPAISDIPNNRDKKISITVIPYSNIQGIEAIMIPLDKLDSVTDNISCLTEDNVKNLKSIFNRLLTSDLTELTPSNVSRISGGYTPSAGRDDYYDGRFGENFKETRPKAELNAYVDSLNDATDDTDEEP